MNDNIIYVRERSGAKTLLIVLLLIALAFLGYQVYEEELAIIDDAVPIFSTVEQQRSSSGSNVVFSTTEPAEVRIIQPTWAATPTPTSQLTPTAPVPASTNELQRGHGEEQGNERGQNSIRP